MPFSGLGERVQEIRARIADAVQRGGHGQDVRLIAVTKTYGPDAVQAAWDAGIRDVGENKVQEAVGKQDVIAGAAAGVRWHLIGHLQRNKVKFLSRFGLFHAMDRAPLADAIHAWSTEQGQVMEVLLQVNVAGEDSKGGYAPAEWEAEAERLRGLAGLRVMGVMTMAPFDAPESLLRQVFQGAREAREVLRRTGHPAHELSMGMSGDYAVAVEEGATMVRVGTVLFGARA